MRIRLNDLAPGVNYALQLRSNTGDAVSEWSRVFYLLTSSDVVAPLTPTNVVGTMSGTTFNLSWDAVVTSADGTPAHDLDHYEVKVESTGTATTRNYLISDTKFQLTLDLNRSIFGSPRANIKMSVRAVDKVGNASSFSAISDQTNAAPANVTGFTGAAGTDVITFKWNAVADTDLMEYRIYSGTTAGSQTSLVWSGQATGASVQSIEYATDKWFKVVAVDVFGTESVTPPVVGPLKPNSPFLVDTTAPSVPTGLAATLTNATDGKTAKAAVTWTAVADTSNDLAEYIIDYKPSSETAWNTAKVDYEKTALTLVGLLPYVNYDFRIRASDWAANLSAWSATVTKVAATNAAPAVPTGLALTAGVDNLIIKWNANTEPDMANGAGVYDVTVSTSSTFASGNLQYRTGADNIAINGLTTGTIYYARVRATDSGGVSSAYSTTVNATTGNFPVTNNVVIQDAAPGPEYRNVNTLWIDTTLGANTPKRWVSGTTWAVVTDKVATDAAAAVNTLNTTTIPALTAKVNAAVKDYVNEYAVSASETVAPTTGWSSATPTRTPGTFIWFRTVITFTDNTTETTTAALLTGNTGATGSQGIPGTPGADGTSLYTWIKYADTPTTGMSDSPTGKTYMGIAINKTSSTESSVYSDYTWSLIKGADGSPGIPGTPGADGTTTYTWVKYGTNSSGAGLSDDPTGKTYIGLAFNKTTAVESTVATDYQWSLIQGPQGTAGTPAAIVSLTATTQALISPAAGGATNPTTSVVTGTAVNTTITAWTYSVDGAAFSATVPAGVSRTGNVVTITGSTMTAKTIAVKMADAAGIADTLTVAKVSDGATGATGSTGSTGPAGADAYTVLLTNEAQVFVGTQTTAQAGSATTSVIAYKGTTQQTATIGTITGQVSGLTTAITNNGTTAPVVTITVTTALTTGGTLTIPVTVGGVVFTKLFSWTIGFAGATGSTGSTGATGVGITSVTPYFQQTASGASAPALPVASPPPAPWVATEPAYVANTDLWRTERVLYTNGTFAYTAVSKVSSYAAAAVAQATADGKNQIIYSTADATGTTFVTGDTWRKVTTLGAGGKIIKEWTFTSGAWQTKVYSGLTLTDLDAGSITTGFLDVANRIQAGSITIGQVNTLQSTLDAKAGQDYVQSRATDLVTNGTGLLGDNTNFSGFVIDKTDAPIGPALSFDVNPAGVAATKFVDEYLPVDTSKKYKFSFQAKQKGTTAGGYMYSGVAAFDAYKLQLSPQYTMYQPNTLTTLAVQLNPGDTTITIATPATPFYGSAGKNAGASTHFRSIIWWDYVDQGGKVWAPETYSRNWSGSNYWADGGITGNVITLNAPYVGPVRPVGTKLSNGSSGGTYMYGGAVNSVVPKDWTAYSATITGIATNGASPSFATGWPAGTSFARIIWLTDRTSVGASDTLSKHSVASVSLSDASAAQATADAVTTLTDGWRYTGTTEINGGSIRTDTIDVIKLKAGSTFTQDLNVANTFTLGTATLDGLIKSYGYTDAGTSGFKLAKSGLVIKGTGNVVDAGVLKGGIITGTTINVGAGGALNVDSTGVIKSNNFSNLSTGYQLSSSGLQVNDGDIDAKALRTNTAVIGDLTIGRSADALGSLKSFGYVVNTTGFKLDKTGLEINNGSIAAATLKIQQGQNLIPPAYADFEFVPSFYTAGTTLVGTGTKTVALTGAKYSKQYISVRSTIAASQALYLGSSITDYNIPVEAGQTYIVSAWVKTGAVATSTALQVKYSNVTMSATLGTTTLAANGAWQRISGTITIPAGVTSMLALVYGATATIGAGFDVDGFQVEIKEGALSTPSIWTPPGMTSVDGGIIRTGEMRSTSNVTVNGVIQPAWSVNMSGNAQFGSALVRGSIVVGVGGNVNLEPVDGDFEGFSNTAYFVYDGTVTATALSQTTVVGEVIAGTQSGYASATPIENNELGAWFDLTSPVGVGGTLTIGATVMSDASGANVHMAIADSGNPTLFTDLATVYTYLKANTPTLVEWTFSTAGAFNASRVYIWVDNAMINRFTIDSVGVTSDTEYGMSAVMSGNYSPGSKGWKIDSSGNTEFNNGTFRGVLKSTTIIGSNVVGGTISAGPINGTHAEVTATGFYAYVEDPIDGVPNQAVRIGTDGDTIGIIDPISGGTLASISQDGIISSQSASILNEIEVQGEDLVGPTFLDMSAGMSSPYRDSILSALPAGLVQWGARYTSSNLTDNPDGVGIFEIMVPMYYGRMYKIQTNALRVHSSIANVGAEIRVYRTTGTLEDPNSIPAAPTVTSSMLCRVPITNIDQTAGEPMALNHLYFPSSVPEGKQGQFLWNMRLLLAVSRVTGSVANVYVEGTTLDPIEFWVEDIGPAFSNGGQESDGGGGVTGTPLPPPSTTPPKTYTQTIASAGAYTFKGDGSRRTDTTDVVQGYNSYNGDGKGYWVFPTLTGYLSGATVNKIEVYAYANHWYYNSGGTALIKVHNSQNSTFPSTWTTAISSTGWPKPGGRWVTLPSSLYAGFKSGTYKGFGVGPANSSNLLYYGRFNGGTSARIRLTYTK